MKQNPQSKVKKRWILLLSILIVFAYMVVSQTLVAHRKGTFFTPDYPKINLSPIYQQPELTDEDYNALFLQTGLGRPAIDTLRGKSNGLTTVLQMQELFFADYQVVCDPMLWRFTCEDHLLDQEGKPVLAPPMVNLEPGDILVSLSTHSMGWRHGHAALVIETPSGLAVLESEVLGSNSRIVPLNHWQTYSGYAVLRVKGLSSATRKKAAKTALEILLDKPYRLTAGLLRSEPLHYDSPLFGAHCFYLVWYAWYHMGYDIDSDGGRLVTGTDMLGSDLVEVVQLYGMNPQDFIEP